MNTPSDHAHVKKNRDMHRRRLEGKWVHTWATSHQVLSKERVSTPYRAQNISYASLNRD